LLLRGAVLVLFHSLAVAAVADMALWHLLIAMCIAVPAANAFASARYANVGPGGYVLAIGVGLAVGVFCGWVMYATHDIVGRKLKGYASSDASEEWYFRLFYLAKVLWLGFAVFVGGWLSSALLRIVF
jgi:hypothetical protein